MDTSALIGGVKARVLQDEETDLGFTVPANTILRLTTEEDGKWFGVCQVEGLPNVVGVRTENLLRVIE